MKKLTSVFLVLMLVLALLPVGVLAQDGEAGTVAEESDTTLTTPVDTTEVKTEGEGELEETPKTEDEPKVEENKVEEEPKTEEVQLEGDGENGEGDGEAEAEDEDEDDEKTYVAAIDEEQYETLAAAITAASAGGTITLLADVTENVVVNKNLTIDLGGKKITNVNDHTITVNSGVTLTITGSGTVDNVTHQRGAIFNKGTVILNGGTYTRSQENGGNNSWYTIKNVGTMTINANVSVSNASGFSSMITNGYYSDSDKAACGGIDAPKLTINGGSFSGGINTIKNDDYGVLEISGGTFSNTTQACVQNHNVATISGGTFSPQNVNAVINCGTNCTKAEAPVKHELTITNGTFNGGISRTVGTITVTGGTFTSDPSDYVDDDYVATASSGTWTVSKKPTVAKIGTTEYTSLASAVADVTEQNKTITLQDNIALDATLDIAQDTIIDLSGHNITGSSVRAIWVKSGSLELTGEGTVTTSDNAGNSDRSVIRVGDAAAAALTVGANVTINAPYTYGVSVFGTALATVNIYGTVTSAVRSAVAGAGNEEYNALNNNTTINIYAGATVSVTGETNRYPAIYHPQKGTLTIGAATISGGIEMKSGTATINGATVTVNSADQTHDATWGAPSTYGYAIAVVKNDSGYKGGASCTINSGLFTGKVALEKDTATATGSLVINGGTFSADPNAYVAKSKVGLPTENGYLVTDKVVENKDGTTTTTEVKTDNTGTTTVTETTKKGNDVVEVKKTETSTTTVGQTTTKTTTTTTEDKVAGTTTRVEKKVETDTTTEASTTTVTKNASNKDSNVGTRTEVTGNTAAVVAGLPAGAEYTSTVNGTARTLKLDATTAAEQGSAKTTEVTIASDATKLLKQDAKVSKVEFVEIKTDVATVTIDNTAIQTMTNSTADTNALKLVVEKATTPAEVKDAKAAYELEALLNGVPVFKKDGEKTNGTVVISVPYTKTNSNSQIKVYYVSDDGKTQEEMVAEYKDGVLTWETNHFSTFVVVEKANAAKDDAAKPADAKKPPRTGDESNLGLWLALALLATCATVTTTVVAKKKNYNK